MVILKHREADNSRVGIGPQYRYWPSTEHVFADDVVP